MLASLAVRVLVILASALLGLWLGWLVQALTWRLRIRSLGGILTLGLLGAGLVALFLWQLFSPYLTIPIGWKVLVTAVLTAVPGALVVYHARTRRLPWWVEAAAQFANLLLILVLIFISVNGRDAFISWAYPVYGETAVDLISTAQSWLVIAMISGLLTAEIFHPRDQPLTELEM